MNIKGKVTKIDLKLCNFELDNTLEVFAGFFVASSSNFLFPSLNSFVVISNIVYHDRTVILTENSVIFCTKFCWDFQKFRCEPFISLIRQSKLSLFDCVSFVKRVECIANAQLFHDLFLRNIKWNEYFNFKEVIVKVLSFVDIKCESIFDNLKLLTPSDYMFKEKIHKIEVSKFSYGVNSFKNNCLLFGYLKISAHTNYISILDAKYALKCQVYSENKTDYSLKLSQMLNNFVVIKNFQIFYEYTKDTGIFNYIFVDIDNIHLIHTRQIQDIEHIAQKNVTLQINLVNKGIVCVKNEKIDETCTKIFETNYGTKKKQEITTKNREIAQCWLQSEVRHENKCLGTKFLVLHGKNFEKYPIFNCGDIYVLQTNCLQFLQLLKSKTYPTHYALNNQKFPVLKIPEDTTFKFERNVKEHLPSFCEIRDTFGKENKHLTVCFEGVVRKRTTGQFPNSPQPQNQNCGIRGPTVQQVTIETVQYLHHDRQEQIFYNHNVDDGEKIYMENQFNVIETKKVESTTIFLKNWAEILTPLGLIDNMKVAFRYAINPQKKDYLRTYFVTTIEPLKYCPRKEFNTTLEILGNNDWGPAESLSNSAHIPTGCLCWGEALHLSFNVLNFKFRCGKCSSHFTTCCGAPKLSLTAGLRGRDSQGAFCGVTREEAVFKHILSLRDVEFNLLKKVLFVVKQWTANLKLYLDEEDNEDENLESVNNCAYENCCDILRYMILIFNRQAFHNVDIKGRKLSADPKDFRPTEKWYPVEARRRNITPNMFETL